jgi:hypothetical protein
MGFLATLAGSHPLGLAIALSPIAKSKLSIR